VFLEELFVVFGGRGGEVEGVGIELPVVVELGDDRPAFKKLANCGDGYFLGRLWKDTTCSPLK
jgi:hypothetical protein